MTTPTGGSDKTTLPPADAFDILGDETRISILQILGAAEEPLSFTELRNRTGIEQGRNFNYHLEKIVGHFVEKTDDGYALRTPGSRVVQAVYSGAVTDHPLIRPTQLDRACYHCGAPVIMTYSGHLAVFCTQCSANYEIPIPDIVAHDDRFDHATEIGFLRGFELPPAGIQHRSGTDLLRAGAAWQNLERIAGSVDMCPRCSATVDVSIEVCESHDPDQGACEECGMRYAVIQSNRCTNCNYYRRTQMSRILLGETAFLNFLTDHNINPIAPDSPMDFLAILDSYDEDITSTDPFEGRFTFTVNGESITLTVDEDLTVVHTTRLRADETK